MAPSPLEEWHRIVRDRDAASLPRLLHEHVVFHSPVVHTPQRGRALTARYLGAALEVLGTASFRYVGEFSAEGGAVLEFETELEGLHVNGVDIIRWDESGQIVDFKVMLRPLKAVNLVQQQMAQALGLGSPAPRTT